MTIIQTTRPRNVDSWRAAAILYGDWGTSKAYVLGLAFALAGYSSLWFILGVCFLTLFVALNYITICKLYPKGGGVYASVRHRSPTLSLIGAFFLIADYLITAALSALSAFHYLGVDHPQIWAIASIAAIGAMNFFGPKHTGSLALALAVPTVIIVVCLGALSLPFLPQAVEKLSLPSGDFLADWHIFVTIIVALSGIEAIANTTGSMRLDPGSTDDKPSVVKTSTPAILMVMAEVCFFTALLGLAMNALPGLEIHGEEVSAPGYPNVRDAMLRYMADTFGTSLVQPWFGHLFSLIVSIVITFLLLSAVNTAIIALISLLFIMSRDGEIPSLFQRLNSFGVPVYATLLTFLAPMLILALVGDIAKLADLYAIGFVGAIAVNLGATSTNYNLKLAPYKRYFMMATFAIMAMIEISLFFIKPQARDFVIGIMTLGLLLRILVKEQKELAAAKEVPKASLLELPEQTEDSLLVAVTGINKSIDYAIQEASSHKKPLYILFIREQKVILEEDSHRLWTTDRGACEVFDYILAKNVDTNKLGFLYTITANTAHSIAEIAARKRARRVILCQKRPKTLLQRGRYLIRMLRGTTVHEVSRYLPTNIDLIVIY